MTRARPVVPLEKLEPPSSEDVAIEDARRRRGLALLHVAEFGPELLVEFTRRHRTDLTKALLEELVAPRDVRERTEVLLEWFDRFVAELRQRAELAGLRVDEEGRRACAR